MKIFISRMGGIGDVIHAAHIPELLREHYGTVKQIDWQTNYQGFHVLKDNPFIDNLEFIDVTKLKANRFKKHMEDKRETYDLVFDFANTIEKEYCTNENDQRYYRSTKWRRDNCGNKSYFDVMVDAAGLPESYYGRRPHLYYSGEDHAKAKAWVAKAKKDRDSDFIIIINLSGSTLHKKFIQVESVCKHILERFPRAFIYLTGDDDCKSQLFSNKRTKSMIGVWNFRTVALQVKYVDLTISLESGIALVAHTWDAPTLQLLTAASPANHVKYAKNAYWLQSEMACSPCHRNPREYFGCPTRDQHPSCIWFNEDKIMDKVKQAYLVTNLVKPALQGVA